MMRVIGPTTIRQAAHASIKPGPMGPEIGGGGARPEPAARPNELRHVVNGPPPPILDHPPPMRAPRSIGTRSVVEAQESIEVESQPGVLGDQVASEGWLPPLLEDRLLNSFDIAVGLWLPARMKRWRAS